MTEMTRRLFLMTVSGSLVSGCQLPRSAPEKREVLAVPEGEQPDFVFRLVDRASLAEIQTWPHTGQGGPLGWPKGGGRNGAAVIMAGDRLDLIIWDPAETSLIAAPGQPSREIAGLAVGPNGGIFLPYVEQVKVAGLTAEGARKRIQDALVEIAPTAQVQLNHTLGRRNAMDVVSGVARPGSYPLAETAISALSMIALAGGVQPGLRNPQLRLIRGGKVYRASLDWIAADPSRDIGLQGGDRLIVEADRRSFTALGASGRQAIVDFTADKINALQAISLMGGVTDNRGDPRGVLILRQYPNGRFGKVGQPALPRVVFSFDLTTADGLFSANQFLVMPEDVVLATQAPVSTVERVIVLLGGLVGLARNAAAL